MKHDTIQAESARQDLKFLLARYRAAKISQAEYIGRSAGVGMVFKGKRAAKQAA